MSATLRWLRADVREVVRIVPEGRGQHPAPAAPGLDESLTRWGARIGRRRAIVLVRRHFLLAAVIVVAAELVAIVLGHGHRPLWLIAPLLLALVDGGVVLAHGVPEAEAARMLDRGLDLHERLETALEIEATMPAPRGLAALVVDEANAALGESLVTARAVGRRSPAEWGWGLAGVAALAVAVAVPGVGRSSATPRRAAAGAPSTIAAVRPAAKAGRQASASSAAPSSSLSGAPALPKLPNLSAGVVNSSPHPAANNALYGSGGHITAAQLAQLTHEGLAGGTGARVAAVGGSTPGADAGASGGAGGGASAGVLGGQASASNAATGGALPPPTATASAQSGAAQAGGHGGSSPGQAGASASAGSGSSNSTGAAPSGGDTAGTTRAALNLGLGLVPDLNGGSRLPLQAEFAPTASNPSSAHAGISENPNGGGGPGRSTTAGGGGIGGAGGFGTGFAVIPPTFNSAPTTVASLLQGYFGVTNQLEFNRW